jgi:DNA modification methylase
MPAEAKIVREEIIGDARLILGDCRDILPSLQRVDAVITDPPYPNEHIAEYQYNGGLLEQLGISRGIVFWTAREPFPLKYSSLHVWDKKIGVGYDYEFIYEIGGNNEFNVYRHYLINSTVAARFTGDEFNEHKSQKPLALMLEIVERTEGLVLDPFMGSGTTGVACAKLGRKFIGIEIEPKYFDIACRRIEQAYKQPDMFIERPAPMKQEALL